MSGIPANIEAAAADGGALLNSELIPSIVALNTLNLASRGALTVSGNTASKTGSDGNWDADVYSLDGYTGGAFASACVPTTRQHVMFGLNTDPLTDSGYMSLDYAWYPQTGGNLSIYESATNVQSGFFYSAMDVLTVTYDGLNVNYLQNGTVRRTVAAPAGLKLFFDSSFYDIGAALTNIRFGPLSSLSGVNAAAVNAQSAADAAGSAAYNANVAAGNAQGRADQAYTNAANAATAAGASATQAAAAGTAAYNASIAASTAQTAANNAATLAGTAQTSADAAGSAAYNANVAAGNAQGKADTAYTNAANAVLAAGGAQSSADAAGTAAYNASIAASNAQGAANTAQTAANAMNTLSLVVRGNLTLIGNTVTKTSGVGGWDSDAYSRESYTGGAFTTGVAPNSNYYLMFGLNTDPATDSSYASLDYAVYLLAGGTFDVYESGNSVTGSGGYGSWTGGDVFAVLYDGHNITYTHNGSVFRTFAAGPGITFFFDSSFNSPGATLTNIRFGPMTPRNTVYYQASTPPSPIEGDLWFNTSGATWEAFTSGAWQVVSDVTASKIAAGIAGQGALATLNQADTDQIAVGAITSTVTYFDASGFSINPSA